LKRANSYYTKTQGARSEANQRRARIRTGLDSIRTEANFDRIKTGSDCNFLKIGGTGLDRTQKIFVVLM